MSGSPTTVALRHGSFDITLDIMEQNNHEESLKRKRSIDGEECGSDSENEQDVVDVEGDDKLARSRERNREHARRTRLRKKAMLQALQRRALELEQEAQALDDALVKIQMANILVDMSTPRLEEKQAPNAGEDDDVDTVTRPALQQLSGADANSFKVSLFGNKLDDPTEDKPRGGLRISAPQPLHLQHQTAVNWKEGYVVEPDGSRRVLSAVELEDLRRERNRMHAKMTRDRKKNLISSIENKITELEATNSERREALKRTLPANVATELITEIN